MPFRSFPVIDVAATGANILRLRQARGFSVRDLQRYFGFEEPQAIYKWQRGQSLPTVDNLYALSVLLGVPMNDILVSSESTTPASIQSESHGLQPVALILFNRPNIKFGRGGHDRSLSLLRPLSAAS